MKPSPTIRTLACTVAVLGLLAACGTSPASSPAPASEGKTADAPAKTTSPEQPFHLASVFPPGAGRDKVLNSCGTCHSAACVTRGQRSSEQWNSVKESHKDKLTNTSSADLNEMFAYLAANFNGSKPEPTIPPELLQQGCTPF